MPKERAPTRDDLKRAERDVGKNIPREMIGEDDGDVRELDLHDSSDR